MIETKGAAIARYWKWSNPSILQSPGRIRQRREGKRKSSSRVISQRGNCEEVSVCLPAKMAWTRYLFPRELSKLFVGQLGNDFNSDARHYTSVAGLQCET